MQNYIKWLSYEIYIYIVVGVLTMYDAWDIIVEIPLTCNQLKFNTCKANEPCMMTNPIDQDLDKAITKLHLTSSLTFSNK